MPPGKLDPGDDDRGTPDHRIEGLQDLLLAEPLAPLDQVLQVGLDGTEVDVLGITSRHRRMIIVWHVGSRQSRGCGASASRSDAASQRSLAMW